MVFVRVKSSTQTKSETLKNQKPFFFYLLTTRGKRKEEVNCVRKIYMKMSYVCACVVEWVKVELGMVRGRVEWLII